MDNRKITFPEIHFAPSVCFRLSSHSSHTPGAGTPGKQQCHAIDNTIFIAPVKPAGKKYQPDTDTGCNQSAASCPTVKKRQKIQPQKNINAEQRHQVSQYDAEKRNGFLLCLKKGSSRKFYLPPCSLNIPVYSFTRVLIKPLKPKAFSLYDIN